MTEKETILSVRDLSLWFGGVRALTDISLDIRKNEILAIIGPNGAGKTCLLNCINGFYQPQKGEIRYNGKKINGIKSDRIAKMGIARTFQNIDSMPG